MQLTRKINTARRVLVERGLRGLFDVLQKRCTHRASPSDYRNLLNAAGKGYLNLLDVGSVGGLAPEWRPYAHHIRQLTNFEPRDEPSITDTIITLDVPLWSEDCLRDFYIYRGFGGSGSSLFRQNFGYVREHFEELRHRGPVELAETWFERSELVGTRQVLCRTLDSVVQECCPQTQFHFMKIDAQGAEYEILRGAKTLMASSTLVGLHLELFVLPLYEGIHLLEEVCFYLSAQGFALAKKFPAHGTFDSQHDCLFLRQGAEGRELDLVRQVYGLR